jgi:hypothetical protein
MTEGAPPWSAQFSLAELEAVVAEAHRLGERVAAHAHGRLGITQAVAAQVTPSSTAHSPGRTASTARISIRPWWMRSPPRAYTYVRP